MPRREVFHIIVGEEGREQHFSLLTIEALLDLGVIKEDARHTTEEVDDRVIEGRYYSKA